MLKRILICVLTCTFLGASISCTSSNDHLKVKKAEKPGGVASASVVPRPPQGTLSLAVVQGDAVQVIRLLKEGADINENMGTAPEIVTPLFLAIASSNSAITQILLQNGADPSVTYRQYRPRDLAHFQGMNQDVLNAFEGQL